MTQSKMEYDGHYAVMEVSFILNDPRLDALTPAQRWLYIVLWCRAVQLKRETIPYTSLTPTDVNMSQNVAELSRGVTKLSHNCYNNVANCRSIARLCRIDARTLPAAVAKLQQLCLINVEANGDITVCGVKKKHPKLKWKRHKLNFIKSNLAPIYGDGDVKHTGTGTGTGKIRGRITDTPKGGRKHARKIPDTEHAKIIDYWCLQYEKKLGIKYGFKKGKDGAIIKRLLKNFSYEFLEKMTSAYFEDQDPWLKKAGFSIATFQARSNQLAQKIANPQNPDFKGLSEKGKEFAQTMIRVGKDLGIGKNNE